MWFCLQTLHWKVVVPRRHHSVTVNGVESGEQICRNIPRTSRWTLFILIFNMFFFPLCWPLRLFFSVVFQLGSVQSSGLWPSHYAERTASGRSFTTAGRLGLFAQTVLHGLTSAPCLQQVSQPTHVSAVSLNIPPDSSACLPLRHMCQFNIQCTHFGLFLFFINNESHDSLCVKGDCLPDEPPKNDQLCSSTQLIVLVFQPAISLFCFTLTPLIVSFSDAEGSCFQWKSSENWLRTACPAKFATSRWTQWSILASKEPDISLSSWWRPKAQLKRKWISDLHSPHDQKHDYKLIIVLLEVWIVCYINFKGVDVSVLCTQLVSAAPRCPKKSVIAGLEHANGIISDYYFQLP